MKLLKNSKIASLTQNGKNVALATVQCQKRDNSNPLETCGTILQEKAIVKEEFGEMDAVAELLAMAKEVGLQGAEAVNLIK